MAIAHRIRLPSKKANIRNDARILRPWANYEFQPSFVLGFHGCDREVGEAVLRGETTLRASNNDYDWLGTGIYFWEGNAQRALDFARESLEGKPVSQGNIENPFLLGAIINPLRCLDLADATAIAQIRRAYDELAQLLAEQNEELPSNSSNQLIRRLDCLVFNTLHALREEQNFPPYDTVRGLFWEGKPIYENAGMSEGNHIQICVRNPDSILGYFRPISRGF